MKKYFKIALAVVFAAAAVLYVRRETYTLDVTRHRFGGGAVGPVRIAAVSDLHFKGPLDDFGREAAEAVLAERPEIVAVLGDMVEEPEGLSALDSFLGIVSSGGARIIAIKGNREVEDFTPEELSSLPGLVGKRGGTLLENEWAEVPVPGGRIRFFGVEGKPLTKNIKKAFGEAREEDGVLTVVLCHSPYYRDFETAGLGGADLMLSGHIHGYQLAPLGILVKPFTQFDKYDSGWYADKRPILYVTRGVGTTRIPVRFWARPEITVIDIEKGEKNVRD